MYKTGRFCPIAGKYYFVKHTDHSPCMLKHDETIQMEYSKNFPPSKICGNPVFWVLLKDGLEIQSREHHDL